MAGTKSSRTKDDHTKKRKRELAEADSRAKRQRAERKSKANGRKSDAELVSSLGGGQSDANALATALETTRDRDLEIIRQFDNAEAGWRVSKPMGGRMLDIDPILTHDDQ